MKENLIVSKEQQEFLTFESIHKRIIICRDHIKVYLYELCKAMKEMHESRAYLTAGYNSFEEYTVDCFGIKKSQAYDYVKIASKYSEEFFDKYGGLGITKLQLFNKMNESEVKEFLSKNNIENMSTRELKSTISEYRNNLIETPVFDIKDLQQDPTELVVNTINNEININSFGDFLKVKRKKKGYSINHLAELLELAKGYYANVESGLRPAFSKTNDVYSKIIYVLDLTDIDIKQMYEIVDKELLKKGKISPDITKYFLDNPDEMKKLRETVRG